MPIYAALLTLICTALAGLALAFWPHESELPQGRAGRTETVASPRLAVDEGLREPRQGRATRTRMKSM